MTQQLSLLQSQNKKMPTLARGRAAIEDGFPFAEISKIAEVESWRKEVFRPIYHLHKWWAQRLGSVFRSIILASALPANASVLEYFYKQNDLNLVVFDPFMGSGTTVGEALKLGCTAIGRDINPVAYNAVRASLSRVTQLDVDRTFQHLERSIGEKIKALYQLNDGSQVLYYFWVKQVYCPDCSTLNDLFDNYIFSRNAYPSKHPESTCYCPSCGEVFPVLCTSSQETCPSCSIKFNPQEGTSTRTKATCTSCGNTFPIAQAVKQRGKPPEHRLYAKLVLLPTGKKEYRRITQEDLTAYSHVAALLDHEARLIEDVFIEPGHNTNQVRNYCYTRWDQFFNARQLLALTWLGNQIKKIEDPELRFVFTVLFSGVLEFNNMFCSFKGEGTGAVRHMFSHHILKPERQPLEANVWGTPKSSGSFSTLYKSRLLRALEYRNTPFEIEVIGNGKKLSGNKRYDCNAPLTNNIFHASSGKDIRPRSLYLSCGDSAHTDLPDKCVDLVVTDPPFFDNVHYSELADFFYAWQRPLLRTNGSQIVTTRSDHEVQDKDSSQFAKKLSGVFAECHRVIKDEGLLVFTYHHSREEGWSAVAQAVTSAGFEFTFAQPIKAEMSVATPKSQTKEPIDIDIILVCRKQGENKRKFLDCNSAFEKAINTAYKQISEFLDHERKLSRNDLRIIVFSHLLVCLSSGRNEHELTADFEKLSLEAQPKIEGFYIMKEELALSSIGAP